MDRYLDQDLDRATFLEKKEQIIKEKQTIKDKLSSLESEQNEWLELMRKWLERLSSICEIVKKRRPKAEKATRFRFVWLTPSFAR